MQWCDDALLKSSGHVSRVARVVSFANAVHAALNEDGHVHERREGLRSFVEDLSNGTEIALQNVLLQLPSLLCVHAADFGLSAVLIAAHFAAVETEYTLNYDGELYGAFSWRLRQVITRIEIVRDLGMLPGDGMGLEALRMSLCAASTTPVPLESSQTPLPGVLTALVVLGPTPMHVVDSDTLAGKAFKAMVASVDRGMLACTAEAGTGTRLIHHLERFAEDAPELLITCIAGGDRVPLISVLRASVLESMRAYIFAAACCALERDCTRSEATSSVLMGMAHYGCIDLLASDVNSTHMPLGDQNQAHWAVLRATLSGESADEASQVGSMLLQAEEPHPGTVGVVGALCGMMRTRMGMMIFCYDPDDAGKFPVASMACAVCSERRGHTVIDALTGSTTGTLDIMQCATPASMEDMLNVVDAMQIASNVTGMGVTHVFSLDAENDFTPSRLVARYCAAVQKVCTEWIERDPTRFEDKWIKSPPVTGARTPQPVEALVAMRRFSAAQVVNHCEAMLTVACDVAVLLEQRDAVLGVPPLICGGEEGASWVRMRFRNDIERALIHVHFQGRLSGCAVLCALVCVPAKANDDGLRCFARMLGTGQFVDVGNDSATSHTRLNHAVCRCALDFERALQNVQSQLANGARLCMPAREAARVAMELANMGRFHAPPLDKTTGVALSPLLHTLEAGEGRVFSSQFSCGSAVAVLTAPSVAPYVAARAARAGVAGELPSSLAAPLRADALLRRLTAYCDTPCNLLDTF